MQSLYVLTKHLYFFCLIRLAPQLKGILKEKLQG